MPKHKKDLLRLVALKFSATEETFLGEDGEPDDVTNSSVALWIDSVLQHDDPYAVATVFDDPGSLILDLIDNAPNDIARASIIAALRAALDESETHHDLAAVPTRKVEATDYVFPK